jgi:hypothetical protein
MELADLSNIELSIKVSIQSTIQTSSMLSVTVLCLAVVVSTRPTSAQPTFDQQDEAAAWCNCDTTQEIVAMQRNLMDLQNFVLTKVSEIDAERLVECPTSFIQVPSVNGCYKLIMEETTWQNASAQCRSMHNDSDLVVINSVSEQNAIVHFISQQLSGQPGKSAWTAGQRIDPASNSTFFWNVRRASSSTYVSRSVNDTNILPMAYTNWQTGQPEYPSWQTESCMELCVEFGYRWNDIPCDVQRLPLCEINL